MIERVRWTNGTPGTGILSSTQQTFSNTSAILCIDNLFSGQGNVIVKPKWFRMIVTAADAAATRADILGTLDAQNRYSSGGFKPIPPEFGFTRSDLITQVPVARVVAGNVVVAAPTANKQNINRYGSIKLPTAAPVFVIGDVIEFIFEDNHLAIPQALQSTVPSKYPIFLGPVEIAPGHSYVLHFWAAAITTGVTFELEGCHTEETP